MNRIYLDNAATTKVHPRVLEKMLPFLKDHFGNPSSIHDYGRNARVAIEDAREIIAHFINADPSEIYFSSNGTEANNFPVLGITRIDEAETGRKGIIVSQAEHSCVLSSADKLENEGFAVSRLPVGKDCLVDLKELDRTLDDKISLVSLLHINNETGAVNNLTDLSKIIKQNNTYFHTDSVQSFGKVRINVKESGVDSLSASAHKIGGPMGVGFTYIKSGTPMEALILGGSQERNRRGGTENAPGIIGFAEAVKIADEMMEDNQTQVSVLRQKFIEGIKQIDNRAITVNCEKSDFPYIVNFTLDSNHYRNDAEAILIYLDINNVAVSNGAACTSGTLKPSHVIKSMGYSDEDANGTLRISFSPENTEEEINFALEVISKMCRKFRW